MPLIGATRIYAPTVSSNARAYNAYLEPFPADPPNDPPTERCEFSGGSSGTLTANEHKDIVGWPVENFNTGDFYLHPGTGNVTVTNGGTYIVYAMIGMSQANIGTRYVWLSDQPASLALPPLTRPTGTWAQFVNYGSEIRGHRLSTIGIMALPPDGQIYFGIGANSQMLSVDLINHGLDDYESKVIHVIRMLE